MMYEKLIDPSCPRDIRGLAALISMVGEGSIDDLKALGYMISRSLVDRTLASLPDIGLDADTGSFSVAFNLPLAWDGDLAAAMLAVERDVERHDMSDQERCFERLSMAAAHLLDNGDAERSIGLLHLAKQLLPAKVAQGRKQAASSSDSPGTNGLETRGPHKQGQPSLTVPLLRVQLYGDLEIELGGEALVRTPLHKGLVRTLFSLLVLNQGKGLPRETAIGWLWPSRDPEKAVVGFYNLWYRLCNTLPSFDGVSPYFKNDERLLRIDPRYVQSDVAEFERLSRQVFFEQGSLEERFACIDRLEQLYKNDILAGSASHPRIQAIQERQRCLFMDVLLTASQLHLHSGNSTMALWYARRAYEADPKREDVYRVLMATQEAAGHRTGAMSTYQECLRYLDEELGVLPSSKTTAIYQDLILDGQ